MIIANPIYDIVFKYLMEDADIAKGLLSVILNVEVTELSLRPQEMSSESVVKDIPLIIYRLDFVAVIKTNNGTHQKVLIELQKTKIIVLYSLANGLVIESSTKAFSK